MCVKPQALLGAMAARLERDGTEPPARDVAALVAAGCTEAEIAAALERARTRRAALTSSTAPAENPDGASGTREDS